MNVLGIDLAASPKSTGVVRLIDPQDQGPWRAEELHGSADDDALVEAARDVGVIGIDSPLGWPSAFVEAVARHAKFEKWSGSRNRSTLTHRETDRAVQAQGIRLPLSVSADKLGSVAMRGALLQQRWSDEIWGHPQPRDGSAILVETYPAAAFAAWGLECTGYKSTTRELEAKNIREDLVAAIAVAVSAWLQIDDKLASRCAESDHVLDALACALVAVSTKSGLTHQPAPEQRRLALVEGWIHVPSAPLPQVSPTRR